MDPAFDLSVVTVTYDDPGGLRHTLESLQLMADVPFSFEVVIVDSSPEENASVVGEFEAWASAHRHSMRHLVQLPPQGIYAAMNAGLHASNGEYVWFLHSRDVLIDIGALIEAITALNERKADQAWLSAALERDGSYLFDAVPGTDWQSNVIGRNRLNQQALIYRRRSLLEIGPFSLKYRISADYAHHLLAFFAGQTAVRIPRVLIRFNMEGISSDWWTSIREYWIISADLRGRFSPILLSRQFAVLALETARLVILKSLAASPLADRLRPLWLGWKRRG